jgi:predicted glycosyltransferase involved in capsule biosynthesis
MNDNITFITHLRYDHDDRVRNLQTTLSYYSSVLEGCKFILVEDDAEHNKNFDRIIWPKNTSFFLLKNDGHYWRTKALNYGIKQSNTPIVILLDTDCIVPARCILDSAQKLLDGATIAYPFNGYVIDTPQIAHTGFIESDYNYNFLLSLIPDVETLMLGRHFDNFYVRCTNNEHLGMGGIIAFNKEKFISIGGWHEKFRSWGCEDNELFNRCNILQQEMYRVKDINSVCFHLMHVNATRHDNPYYNSNVQELDRLRPDKISKDQLLEYIKTWNYFK